MDKDYLIANDWWARVDIGGPDDCWLWRMSCGSHRYGQTWDGKSVLLAHRVAWTLTFGDIPEDITVDHRCRVRRCCNPAHLRLLPNVVNAANNGNAIKTHCPRGHEYNERNTQRNRYGHRQCRLCRQMRRRKVRL